ncbi:hypothetical protein JCM10207_005506 [Rhodosporidiobolus poonsookiae]
MGRRPFDDTQLSSISHAKETLDKDYTTLEGLQQDARDAPPESYQKEIALKLFHTALGGHAEKLAKFKEAARATVARSLGKDVPLTARQQHHYRQTHTAHYSAAQRAF